MQQVTTSQSDAMLQWAMLIDVAESEYMTVAEVAAELRVDQETVRRWLRVGKLHGVNLGGAGGWRIRKAEYQRFVSEREH